MDTINYSKERTKTIRTSRHPRGKLLIFPRSMPLWARKEYVKLHREINFNDKFNVNLDYNEIYKDNAHKLVAKYYYIDHSIN